jgi:hypothetical protein
MKHVDDVRLGIDNEPIFAGTKTSTEALLWFTLRIVHNAHVYFPPSSLA